VVTPHIKWADPYARGPIRAFFVSSVHEGRTVVELMQRLTLKQRAVSIDPRWDVNKWCMDRYPVMDSLLPRDYSLAFRVLEEELATDVAYDVLAIHGVRGWNEFPARVKELLRGRVMRGEGLVIVHPHLGEGKPDRSLWEISPIVGVPPTTLEEPGAGIDDGYPHPPKEAMSGEPWRQVADHYIVRNIPFEALPYPALQHYRYRLARDAQALATGKGGGPVVAVKQYGRGRVVGLGYHNYGLFPELRARRGELNESFWEYLFGLLMRSIIWAARKEPGVQLTAVAPSAPKFAVRGRSSGTVQLRLHNSGAATAAEVSIAFCDGQRRNEGQVGRKIRLSRGQAELVVPLPKGSPDSGRHFADVSVATGGKKQDWGTATYEVERVARVAKVVLDAPAVAVGDPLAGRARLAGRPRGLTLVAELWDQRKRLLASQSTRVGQKLEVGFQLRCPEALTNLGWVKCRLMDGKRLVDEGRAEVALTAPRRQWEDYEVILPWLHGGLWPWTDLIEDQYQRAGITSTSDPQYNFSLTVSMHPPGFGIYWYRRHSYLERRALYGKTKDTRYLARIPCFHSDEFRKPVAAALRKGIPPILKYSPLAYYLADESSITCYEDALDLCWSEATISEFRKWLRKHYRTLAALNAEWGTQHRSWQAVMPATWEEAQRRGNPAPWVDHRLFMNRTLADAFRYAVSVAKRVDPGGLVTISGTQLPGSHNGCDWWKVDQIIDYLQPYSGGGQDEMHRSFNPKLILTGFTGYALSGLPLEYEIWHRFFHGHRGASIFWGYSFVDPDLTLNAQGRSFVKTFGQLRGEGICRAITGLTREHDRIAMHYSMASGHVWWVQDGWLRYPEGELEYGMSSSPSFQRFIRSRVAWGQVLEDIGYQYDYLSYEQIEKGDLTKHGFRALVLPGSIALSDREVQQIRAFVKAGGLVLADVRPGTTDEHGKRRPTGALDDVFSPAGFGRGRGSCPNRWLDGYSQVRLESDGRAIREMVLAELHRAKLAPRATVEGEGGRHPVGVERVSWRGDGVEVLGLLKEPQGSFKESADGTMGFVVHEGMKEVDSVKVLLPRRGHWYDLRGHRYLGDTGELKARLHEADPKLYAMLPYRVEGIRLSVTGGTRRGAAVRYAVRIRADARATLAPQVVETEVFGPDGEKRAAYSRNTNTRNGVGAGEFRLALNDPRGTWRIVATDVFSGASAEQRLKAD
jgi:hypothetical protein